MGPYATSWDLPPTPTPTQSEGETCQPSLFYLQNPPQSILFYHSLLTESFFLYDEYVKQLIDIHLNAPKFGTILIIMYKRISKHVSQYFFAMLQILMPDYVHSGVKGLNCDT